ncbi:BCLAF1 and THRAP3 family member 3 [Hyperolius riggenbachi]|uniref:BCLAF1 and THRAP3 family member 3 n=1 Tax=Hyperolius riggenbachi TaxID=752182 RepID=UPI0035A2DC6E
MAKSRSRSPRWKPRPPLHRSPEHNRQRPFQDHYHDDDDGFHRDSRRPAHWENERRHNNSRNTPYNYFNDNKYEQGLPVSDLRRSPYDTANRLKKVFSPERRGESNRRLPPKCPTDTEYKHHNRNFYNDRIHERNAYNSENVHNNSFKAVRREDSFRRPYNRDFDRDWREGDGHWKQHDHPNQYFSPPRRRPEEFIERKSVQKRFPEDDYREPEQPFKRYREAERHDFRPQPRSSQWKDGHPERPYYADEWSKDRDQRAPNPVVHKKHSGEFTKLEYDYSHKSSVYVHTKPISSYEHAERHNRNDEKKTAPKRTSQHHKSSDRGSQERRYDDRSSGSFSKYSSRKDGDNDYFKNNIDMKYPNHKHNDKERKEDHYWRRREDEKPKDLKSPRHLSSQNPQSQDSKAVLKITPEKEISPVNLALKKSTDKYREPHQLKNLPKALLPKSEAAQIQRPSDGKQILDHYIEKRSKSTSKERQMSQDLVAVAGKEKFHPVFEHLDSSVKGGAAVQSTEFTHEIITIIHEVKGNHFRSTRMSLHERFSKLQEDGDLQEINPDTLAPQSNPEIHRRIDISLEELQNKSLKKTVEVQPARPRAVEDPHDLRHDIERRRKQRLHSEHNGTTDEKFGDSDASGSCYGLQSQETGELQTLSRMSRSSFDNSTGRTSSSYYKGQPDDEYYTSTSDSEDSDEISEPYKGWRNPAARI